MKKLVLASALLGLASAHAQSPEFKKNFEDGNMKYEVKAYSLAIASYDKALQQVEKSNAAKTAQAHNKYMAEVYAKRGMCHYFTGSVAAMKRDAETALSLDSGRADARALLAYDKYKTGDKKQGCKDLRKSIIAGSDGGRRIFDDCFCLNDAVSLAKEAVTMTNLQKYDDAISLATDAIGILPDSGYIYGIRAKALLGKNRPDQALNDMHLAVAKKNATWKAYYTRALVYLQLGKKDSAFLDLDKCIDLKKDNYDAILKRAELNEELQQWNAAIYDYTLLTKLQPERGGNYYRIAVIKHQHQEDLLGACDYYKAAAARGVEEAQEMSTNCASPRYMKNNLKPAAR